MAAIYILFASQQRRLNDCTDRRPPFKSDLHVHADGKVR